MNITQSNKKVNTNLSGNDENLKERIRDANPIEDVFSELFLFSKKASNSMYFCPFHKDTNASLGFYSKDRTDKPTNFKCLGCQKGGDVFRLVQDAKNFSFREALEFLADRAGIEIPKRKKRSYVVEKVYIYRDENGQYLYEKRRFKGKKFFIYTKDSDGKELFGQGKIKSTLYNLPQIASSNKSEPIIYTEGEKDADNLTAVGFISTTCGGVSVWPQVVNSGNHKILQGRDVWIMVDNDAAGKKHELDVANSLIDIARQIKIIQLPMEYSDKSKDFSDFMSLLLSEGKNKEDIKAKIEEIASQTDVFVGDKQTAPPIFNLKNKKDFESSEWINALLHRHHMMFHEDRFHIYNDGAYHTIRDTDTEIGGLLEELGGPDLTKKNIQEVIFKLKIRLHNNQKQKNLVINDPWILNLKNGWIDLRDERGTLKKHTPDLLTTFKTDIELATDATCPEFDAFLDKHYPEMSDLIWEMMGYLLIPSTMFQKAFFIQGPPETGKSTLIEVIELLLGRDRYSSVNLDKFTDRFSLSLLDGKLANITIETGVKGDNTDKILKAIISGDSISIEEKFKQGRSIKPTARLLIASNFFLKTQDTTRAFFRRWIAIPAFVEVQKTDKIEDYAKKMFDKEKQGILVKALVGLMRLRKQKEFTEVESCQKLKSDWETRSDLVKFWAEECLTETGNQYDKIKWADLRTECNNFIASEGFKSEFGKHEFNDRMANLGYNKKRDRESNFLIGYAINTTEVSNQYLKAVGNS